MVNYLDPVAVSMRIEALEENKLPVLTRGDLLKCGMSRRDLRRAIESGTFVRIGHGAYTPATKLRRAENDPALRHALDTATVLTRLREQNAVAGHTSAARIHGLDLLDLPPDGEVTLTRPPGTGNRSPVRVHVAALPDEHVTRVHGVPVVVPGRAVHDIAREQGFAAGLVTADSLLRRHAFDARALHAAKDELARVVGDCRRWPGSIVAAKVVRCADERSESAFESLSRAVIIESDLPMPMIQITLPELPQYRVDFLWHEQRVIAEPDGLKKYAGDPGRVAEEKIRHEKIVEAGYEIVHYVWKEMRVRPETVIKRIEAAFRRARRLGYWQ